MRVLKEVRKMSRIKAGEVKKQNDSGLTGSVGNTSQHIFSRSNSCIFTVNSALGLHMCSHILMSFKYVFIPSIHTRVQISIENEALVDLSLSKGLVSTYDEVAYVVSTAPLGLLGLGFLCTWCGPKSQCCLAGSVSAASLRQDAAGLCKLGRGDVEEGGTRNQSQQRQVLLQPVQAGDGDNAVGMQQPVTEEDDQTLLLGDQTLKRLNESRTCQKSTHSSV